MSVLKSYGFSGFIGLLYAFVMTKIFFGSCRLVRQPIYIRNRNLIDFGKGLTTGRHCRIDCFPIGNKSRKIVFGRNCQINDNVHLAAASNITFGDNVLIASRVYISDHNHGAYKGNRQSNPSEIASERHLETYPISIGDNVWIGEGVAILPGVSIGNNTVIGANSVVTRSFGDDLIIAGNPAQVIKIYCGVKGEWELKKDVSSN